MLSYTPASARVRAVCYVSQQPNNSHRSYHIVPVMTSRRSSLAPPGGGAPDMPRGVRFDTIVASDVLYDRAAADLFPRVVAALLAPGGRCVVCGPVRDRGVQEAYLRTLAEVGLAVSVRQVDEDDAHRYRGVRARRGEYEGGYVMSYIQRADSPCRDWWRDDLRFE